MVTSYEFFWDALAPGLLRQMAWQLGLDMDHPADAIEGNFGDSPSSELVRATANALVDRWLMEDSDALEAVQSACGYPAQAEDDLPGFAARIASSDAACEVAAYWLFLRGLRPSGSVYADLERPWDVAEAPEPIDYSVARLQEELRARLMVDDEWVVVEGVDWTWWPTAAPIRISVGPPKLIYGDVTYRITARCPLVENLDLDDSDRMARLALMNREASLFALVRGPDSGTIDAVCAFSAHAGNETAWVPFSAALVLMANFGRSVNQLADRFSGSPVSVPHPISGLRSEADELAYFVQDVILPDDEQGRFADDASAVDFRQWPGCALQLVDDHSRLGQAELAFYNDLPVISARSLGWTLGTSLVQVDGEAHHPELGHGMLGTLSLPDLEPFPPHFAAIAAELMNEREASEETGFAFMGAWWAERREGAESRYDLKFSQFVPSYFYDPGLASWVAWNLTLRNWWLAEWCEDFAQSVAIGDEGIDPE
jgi:hypothetical protein